jgi:hypothetical protein
MDSEMRRYQEDQAADTETSAAHYKYTSVRSRQQANLILLVLVLVPRPSHTESYKGATGATTTSADQNLIRLTKTYYC